MAQQHEPDPAPRTGPEEQEYLLRRADDHHLLAERTGDSDARAIHLRLRQLYLQRAGRAVVVHQD